MGASSSRVVADPSTQDFDVELSILVVGSQGVGKTSFIHKFVWDDFREDLPSTNAPQTYSKVVETGDVKVKLNICDEGRHAKKSKAYKNLNAVVVCVDISTKKPTSELESWKANLLLNHVHSEVSLFAVGCKSDLDADRVVAKDTLQEKSASLGFKYFESSAKASQVDHLFDIFAAEILSHRTYT